MAIALYRKYRSKSFSEVAGQEHITKTLSAALKAGKISHAYLFTGPRGVGKTSIARILAHEVNGFDYDNENIHLDIIEIDAASNRRIDEIRDLREKVHITPTSGKYKVYIIDEVHMLTKEAFNALLKTLEEPPEHVIFILATTESHKLPETIVSRTQRFNFKAFSSQAAFEHLKYIAAKEKIDITDEALNLLAEFGDGSMRDSISLLDQLSSMDDKVTQDDVRQQLGLPKQDAIDQLINAIKAGDKISVLQIIDQLKAQATDAENIAKMMAKTIRGSLSTDEQSNISIKLLRDLLDISSSLKPYDTLEIALLQSAGSYEPEATPKHAKVLQSAEVKQEVELEKDKPDQEPPKDNQIKKVADTAFSLELWDDVLAQVKLAAASTYTALRLATPTFDENILTLAFEFPLHQKKIEQAKAKDIISKAIEKVSGQQVQIECIVNKRATSQPKKIVDIVEPEDESLQAINSIFGSTEVLES